MYFFVLWARVITVLTNWFRIGLRTPRTYSAKPSRSPGRYFTQGSSEYDLIVSKILQSLPKATKITTNNTVFCNLMSCTQVFLNHRPAARYRALASIIPGRERPEETTICYKISLVQLITNLNVILYLSTCHNITISVLILFKIMP